MRQSTAKLAQVHTSLRTASEIARSTPTSAAELARLVKSRHPEISAAQCRRAVDQVLEVRGTRRRSPARKIDPIAAQADPLQNRPRDRPLPPIGFPRRLLW